jgi:hypothetical protein
MKKILTSLVLIPFIAFASSLAVKADELTFTAKIGLNFTNIGGDDADKLFYHEVMEEQEDYEYDLNTRTGFHIGGMANYRLTEKFSLNGGLLFSTKGVKMEYEHAQFGVTMDGEIFSMYIDIPILMSYTLMEGLSVSAGIQPSLLLSAEYSLEYRVAGVPQEDIEEDMKSDLSSLDLAAVIGAGYRHDTGISLHIAYDFGLLTMDDEGDFDFKNRAFKVSLGYTF